MAEVTTVKLVKNKWSSYDLDLDHIDEIIKRKNLDPNKDPIFIVSYDKAGIYSVPDNEIRDIKTPCIISGSSSIKKLAELTGIEHNIYWENSDTDIFFLGNETSATYKLANVDIVASQYNSVKKLLHSFDLPCCRVAYDSRYIWFSYQAVRALVLQEYAVHSSYANYDRFKEEIKNRGGNINSAQFYWDRTMVRLTKYKNRGFNYKFSHDTFFPIENPSYFIDYLMNEASLYNPKLIEENIINLPGSINTLLQGNYVKCEITNEFAEKLKKMANNKDEEKHRKETLDKLIRPKDIWDILDEDAKVIITERICKIDKDHNEQIVDLINEAFGDREEVNKFIMSYLNKKNERNKQKKLQTLRKEKVANPLKEELLDSDEGEVSYMGEDIKKIMNKKKISVPSISSCKVVPSVSLPKITPQEITKKGKIEIDTKSALNEGYVKIFNNIKQIIENDMTKDPISFRLLIHRELAKLEEMRLVDSLNEKFRTT
jgi:hypothetical protein